MLRENERKKKNFKAEKKLKCGPMPNLMIALCSTPQFG